MMGSSSPAGDGLSALLDILRSPDKYLSKIEELRAAEAAAKQAQTDLAEKQKSLDAAAEAVATERDLNEQESERLTLAWQDFDRQKDKLASRETALDARQADVDAQFDKIKAAAAAQQEDYEAQRKKLMQAMAEANDAKLLAADAEEEHIKAKAEATKRLDEALALKAEYETKIAALRAIAV